MNRHEPDGSNAQMLKIIKFRSDAIEIANAITIGIIERTDKYLIENCLAPPGCGWLRYERRDCGLSGKRCWLSLNAGGNDNQKKEDKTESLGHMKKGRSFGDRPKLFTT